MKLYHGSSAAYLEKMQRDGIAPRAVTKGKDNWKHTVTSNRNAVYLTSAYAWHFAACASDTQQKGLILEVDKEILLPWKLCPDEDFLEQATRKQGPSEKSPNFAPTDWSMKKRTMFYRKSAKYNSHQADMSLEHMGTAAYYGVIPWKLVTRYVVIDWSKLDSSMHLRAVDSMVSMVNYRILQDRHKAFTRWLFNDPVTASELIGTAMWLGDNVVNMTTELRELSVKQDEHMTRVMQNRSGLEVVNLKKVETEVAA